ncbi:RAB6-interacting golgin isoform X2 [Globicephala melas]|uniref:RAB6-interacting golgin isoform X2 n=1 Tax=Globicephala melas TaxID=9731 RepID=UPI00293D4DA9|nr:RAB6-interacting golgin isoform X2 [Globicephala melas]
MARGWAGFSEEELRRLKQTKGDFCSSFQLLRVSKPRVFEKIDVKYLATYLRLCPSIHPYLLTLVQEKSRWEVLQQEQRLMEEKNKRKKALLAKAIAERSKRTQAETMKLKRIQKELQALDDMVSADIGILRNRIDQASLDYSYAWKRFDRAEAEYVTAKLDLQRKTELKEQLTEHLCTIIQQNELRKAKKLEELMQQLDVHADEETLELEVEVERLLCEQEAEVGKQVVHSERPFQPSGENMTVGFAKENKKHQDQAASPKVDEQCESSSSIALLDPDQPNQEVETTVKDISAALTT